MKDTLCKFYLRHSCKKGVECKFLHKKEEQFCWHYQKRQKCKFKDKCVFKHEQLECKFYRSGKCKFSSYCWFTHNNYDEISRESKPQGFKRDLTKKSQENATKNVEDKSCRRKLTGKTSSLRKQNSYLRKELESVKAEMQALTEFINTLRKDKPKEIKKSKPEETSQEDKEKDICTSQISTEATETPSVTNTMKNVPTKNKIGIRTREESCLVDKQFCNNLKNYFKLVKK